MRTLEHTPVRRISDGKDVRRHFMSLLSLVQIDDLFSVNRQPLVRIDHDAEQPGVRLQ